jgi:hypothetical protein
MNITMRFQRQLSTTCFTKDVSTVDKKMKLKADIHYKKDLTKISHLELFSFPSVKLAG